MKIDYRQILLGLIIGMIITFLLLSKIPKSIEPGTQEFEKMYSPANYRFSGIGDCDRNIEISYNVNGKRITEKYNDCTSDFSLGTLNYCSCRGLY